MFKTEGIVDVLKDGQRIIADDGHFVFTVIKKGRDLGGY